MSQTDLVKASLRKWAEDLVDLTRNNRLLYFRHVQTASLEFQQSASVVEAGLSRPGGWGFFLPPAPDSDEGDSGSRVPGLDELVTQMQPPRYGPKIELGLTRLWRTSEAEFLNSGVQALYLGLGRLDWSEPNDGKAAQSPLLLLPVRLTRGTDRRWLLKTSDNGEPALNPALTIKLSKDFGIELPSLDDLEEPTVTNVLEAVKTATRGNGWSVADVAVLRTFTFHKEVIYRDLIDNTDEIADHPLVEMLALGPTSEAAASLEFRPDDEEDLDRRHPPEDLVCVLDADATQRQCLIAARGGKSFVMDGPPGTGKSQTIANLIAQLLADSKTVLFVSEKAAALEVVHSRLSERKLDPFVLALHSQKATRKAVAQELGAALAMRPLATSRFDASSRGKLRQRRLELTAYAVAINEVRQPLGWSVHDAIGRIAELDKLPPTPIPNVHTSGLTADEFNEIRDRARELSRSWGPVSRADDFVWRELKEPVGGATRRARSDQARGGA